METLCGCLYAANTSIDCFPTNFVPCEDMLYYVDYECNDYMAQWNFQRCGVKFWRKMPEFLQYLQHHP